MAPIQTAPPPPAIDVGADFVDPARRSLADALTRKNHRVAQMARDEGWQLELWEFVYRERRWPSFPAEVEALRRIAADVTPSPPMEVRQRRTRRAHVDQLVMALERAAT